MVSYFVQIGDDNYKRHFEQVLCFNENDSSGVLLYLDSSLKALLQTLRAKPISYHLYYTSCNCYGCFILRELISYSCFVSHTTAIMIYRLAFM